MAIKYVTHNAGGSGTGTDPVTDPWTLAQALAATPAAGDEIRICATGTYSRSTTGTIAYANGTANAKIRVYGANSSGVVDGTRPTIQLTASSLTGLNVTGSHVRLRYLIVDGNSQTTSTGITIGASYSAVIQSKALNCTVKGINVADSNNQAYAARCEATGCSGTAAIYIGASTRAIFCEAYGNTTHGIQLSSNGYAIGCISSGNTGTSDGFNGASVGYFADHCTAYGNGRSGFDLTGNAAFGTYLSNCVSYGNTTADYGSNSVADGAWLLNCAGRAGASSGTGIGYNTTNVTNVEGYVTLSADPFVSSGTGNFAPDATNGASLKAAGYPGAMPRGTTTGYADVGIQHQDAGGGGTIFVQTINSMILNSLQVTGY